MSELRHGNPKAACVRLRGISKNKMKASRAHIMRTGAVSDYIDQSRTHLNTCYNEAASIDQVFVRAVSRREKRLPKRSIKSNASIVFEGLITFGAELARWFEELACDVQNEIFITIIKKIAEMLGTSCTAFAVHRDETTTHVHFEILAYNKDGVALSTLLNRDMLSGIQDIAHAVLIAFLPAAERGRKREIRLQNDADPRELKNLSVEQLHATLPADIAKAQATLQRLIYIRSSLERNKELGSKKY
jgi:hypothetical protein